MKAFKYLAHFKRGFSLAEIMVAVCLLTIALLAITGIFFAGISAIKRGNILSQVSDLAYNEKVYLELYDFDELVENLSGTVYPPFSSDTFFGKEYPRRSGKYWIECTEVNYSTPRPNFQFLYVNIRVSDTSLDSALTLSRSDYVEVELDVIIPRNKN